MNDFGLDLDDADPFATPDDTPAELRPLGLIVPLQARQIRNAKGRLIFDELFEALEPQYRKNGRPPVIFEDEDEDASTPREPWREMS